MRNVGKAIKLAHGSPRGTLYVYGDVYFAHATIRCSCGHEEDETTEAPWFWECAKCGRKFAVAKRMQLIEYEPEPDPEPESGVRAIDDGDGGDGYRRMKDGAARMHKAFAAAAAELVRDADAAGAAGLPHAQRSLMEVALILIGLAAQQHRVAS